MTAVDLRARLHLAGASLLAVLDPEREMLPTGGWEVAHDLGRWWDAVLRLEEAVGFAIPEAVEAASLRNLQRLTANPDRLLLNDPAIPWLREKSRVNLHNLRETLLAYGGLVRRRQCAWARARGLDLVRTMDRCLRPDGRFDPTALASWGRLPGEPVVDGEPNGAGWFDGTATTGRSLEALVWFAEATGAEEPLVVARRIAAHHLEHTTRDDGRVRPEITDPANVGHDHSYLGTLRGLLRFGLLTGERPYVEKVEVTYRRGVRRRIVKESGWAPHDLGKDRFANAFGDPVSDPASTGDAAQLALWLAREAGCDDLWDDVERYVRARLLPAQLTPADLEALPQAERSPRRLGAWGIHGPTHGGKGCTPDVLAAVTHSLCDVHQHLAAPTARGLRVNLHFDGGSEGVRVTGARDGRGTVRVRVGQGGPLQVRIPGWAPTASLALSVGGVTAPLVRRGVYACVDAGTTGPDRAVELSYHLPERQTEERMPSGRTYRIRWRGDAIAAVDPQDGPLPFYPEW
ncbi:MAG: hypothetical protein ABIL09_11235 [Gemmatimonadota bacterium]